MENLNPNCLIYVDKSSKISDTSKNIVVFNNGEGNAEAITLEDGHPFNNTKEFTAASISYTRDFSGMNGWASLYLPFAVKVEGYTIETLADYTSQEDKGYFSFESVTRTRTTANTPYIMAVNSETNGVFTGSGIVPVATAANDVSIDNGTYVFKGTFNEIAAGSAMVFICFALMVVNLQLAQMILLFLLSVLILPAIQLLLQIALMCYMMAKFLLLQLRLMLKMQVLFLYGLQTEYGNCSG